MKVITRDPVSKNEVTDIDKAPFLVEGHAADTVKTYFESDANKAEYLAIPLELSDGTLEAIRAMLIRILQQRLSENA